MTPDTIARLFVPRQNGGLVRLDNVVKLVPTKTASRIDRLDRQRQVSLRAAVAPGYAQADRIAALRAEVEKMGLPDRLLDARLRPRARIGNDLPRIPLGVPAVGDPDVHHPRLAVREPHPSVHHSAVAAAVGAVCLRLAAGRRTRRSTSTPRWACWCCSAS